MILFQITLSPAMIKTMQYIQRGSTGYDESGQRDHLPQFLNSVRKLQAEGLVRWFPTGDHSMKWLNKDGTQKKEGGPHFEITRKGELALELVSLEVLDVQTMLLPNVRAISAPVRKITRKKKAH